MMSDAIQPDSVCFCADLPEIDYQKAWKLQSRLVEARKSGILDKDIFLLLEHPSVFTLGRRGGKENLTVSEAFIHASGISIVHVERGGNITYHGPGQLVGYPIIDLHAAGLTVTDYVDALEELMIRTAAHWGVQAVRNPMNHGVWVGNRKLGSIGIAIRRGISFHGFAFNVNVALAPFRWINPCGLEGIGMTSMEQEISHKLPMEDVRKVIQHNIAAIFQVHLAPVDGIALQMILDAQNF